MSLTSAPVLPLELVELIVEHLSGSHTLRCCALISRMWAVPCQRALFHNLYLYQYMEVVRLPAHLIRYPHLQRFIQHVSLRHSPWNIETRDRVPLVGPRHSYLSGLAALFPLISHTTSLDVTFDRRRHWDTHDQRFVQAFGAFLQQYDSLKVLDIRGLQDRSDLQQIFSFLNGTQVQQLSLHTEGPNSLEPIRVDFFNPTLTIAHLPAVEFLRINSHDAFELAVGLNLAIFPKLKHLEIVVYNGLNLGFWFSDILKPAALRLETFRLELTCNTVWDNRCMPIYENLFDGLQFQHLQLHMSVSEYGTSIDIDDAQDIVDWFSAMFRHLVEAGSSVLFTELTFTFTVFGRPDWGSVDEVLCHAAFGGVKQIHFEEESQGRRERTLITNLEHPELVSAIRDTFPGLASRGVLCFEERQVGKVERGVVSAS